MIYPPTQDNIEKISAWTPIDEDLDGQNSAVTQAAISIREEFGLGVDLVRSGKWEVPEGIDCFEDIPYCTEDAVPAKASSASAGAAKALRKAHSLDVYIPHDAYLRGGKTIPLFIDIHGGGFVYGYKDLNKNFGVHLAQQGLAVISLGYRLAPGTDFLGQLHDIFDAFHWIENHIRDYPIDPKHVFITGDSAGATLGLYALAIATDPDVARAFGIEPGSLAFSGAVFVSGLFDIDRVLKASASSSALPYLVQIGGMLFDGASRKVPEGLLSIEGLTKSVCWPPIMLVTSSDDFLESESLRFAACLSEKGTRFEIQDHVPAKASTLGHVFPVGQTWIPESAEVLSHMKDFAYDLI
jgi:acetyl esterase